MSFGLIVLSPMTIDVKNISICFLAIHLSYFVKYLFRSLSHVLIGLFAFLTLSCKNVLYTPKSGSL